MQLMGEVYCIWVDTMKDWHFDEILGKFVSAPSQALNHVVEWKQ